MIFAGSCKDAIKSCIENKCFAVAHLYNYEKPMNIHIHDCYEIYYSISGGKQFLIDNRFYDFQPGDIFFINQYESHYLSQIDSEQHERIILSIHPEYLKQCSSSKTDLNYCFSHRNSKIGHKLSLSQEEQQQFQHLIHKLAANSGYGDDIMDHALFLQIMTFLNRVFIKHCESAPIAEAAAETNRDDRIDDILSFINQHIRESLNLERLAEEFYLSPTYLCHIFKAKTGTTINKYIIAQRITLSKSLLAEGHSVSETCTLSGFSDYSNFIKAFTKTVGISPKKYAQITI